MNILLDDDVAAKSPGLVPEAQTFLRAGRRMIVVHGPGPGVARHGADQSTDITLVYPAQGLDVEIVGPGLEVDEVDEFLGV